MGDYLNGLDLPLSESEDEDSDEPSEQAFFEYRAVHVKNDSDGNAAARFVFTASDLPGRDLVQWLHLPFPVPEEPELSEALLVGLFNIGMVLLLWPWMHFGHRLLKVRAGALSDEQAAWWRWFYRGALAEWAALNGRGLRDVELELAAAGRAAAAAAAGPRGGGNPGKPAARQVLCPLGGGKDSLVVFELLRHQAEAAVSWLYVGDGVGEFERSSRLRSIVARSGVPCIVFEHDFGFRQVSDLRARAHLGQGPRPAGHPWAALVGFDAALACVMLGFNYVAVGNEHSANFGNGVFLQGDSGEQLEVNHQFDKSLEFECAFHDYVKEHITSDVHHFSPLQNLWELQIVQLFVSDSQSYLDTFISCNNSSGSRSWCLRCEKCCFVFAMLAAFMDIAHVTRIFGKNLLDDPSLLPRFRELIGEGSGDAIHAIATGEKPFECIGEPMEALAALALARSRWSNIDSTTGQQEGFACLKHLSSALDRCDPAQVKLLLAHGPATSGQPASGRELLPAWWRWPPSVLPGLAAAAEEAEVLLESRR